MSFIFENGSRCFDRTLWPLYKSGSGSSSLSPSGITALRRQGQNRGKESTTTCQTPTLSLEHTVVARFSLLLPLSEPHSLRCFIDSPNNCYLINWPRLQNISESGNEVPQQDTLAYDSGALVSHSNCFFTSHYPLQHQKHKTDTQNHKGSYALELWS